MAHLVPKHDLLLVEEIYRDFIRQNRRSASPCCRGWPSAPSPSAERLFNSTAIT
jgi:hypothetical protein